MAAGPEVGAVVHKHAPALARSPRRSRRHPWQPRRGTAGPEIEAAVRYAVLLERVCRTQLTVLAAGGPERWSSEAERFKRDQEWNPRQLLSGWEYLVRTANVADR
jgi:ribulose-5-phosphate 4-epimerase/fuculose-1-phosphate aldolase